MKKKIAFVVSNLNRAGTQNSVLRIITKLNSTKHIKYLIVLNKSKEVKIDNVNIIYLNYTTKSIFFRPINFLKKLSSINKIKKDLNFDFVVSFLLIPNLLNLLTRKETEYTYVSIRNYVFLSYSKIFLVLYKFLIIPIYKKADLIITVSKKLKLDLITKYKIEDVKIKVIVNGLDIQEIKELSDLPIKNEELHYFGSPTLVTVGRLTNQKGNFLLLDTYKSLRNQYSSLKLIIIGKGKNYKKIIKYLKKYKLTDSVRLLGERENPYRYISNSDIFILSSKYEGFPNVILEAMACEIPVISTNCLTGPNEIIDSHRDGILVGNPKSIKLMSKRFKEELANAITHLINNEKLQFKLINNAKHKVSKYDIDNVILEWGKIFK